MDLNQVLQKTQQRRQKINLDDKSVRQPLRIATEERPYDNDITSEKPGIAAQIAIAALPSMVNCTSDRTPPAAPLARDKTKRTERPKRSIDALPRASAQLRILYFLYEQQNKETGKTSMLSRSNIAAKCAVPTSTVKISIERLLRKGFLQSIERNFSCCAGGAVYGVPKRWVGC